MKNLTLIIALLMFSYNANALASVCYPAMSGGGWDCFGSSGNCGTTFSACQCIPSSCDGGSGSSSSCSTCCCRPATSVNGTNCVCNIEFDINNDMHFTAYNQRSPKNIGSLSQVVTKTDELFQYEVDLVNRKIIFTIYDATILSSQVATNGYINNKNGAYLRQTVIYY